MSNRALIGSAILALCIAATGGVARAHSPLKHSVPQNGAVVAVTAAPKQLELHFGHALRLTSVSLRSGSATVALEASPKPAASHRLRLPALVAGEYVAEWRGMAADGHVMSGAVRFKVTSR